ncbi:hypothetical protein [Candidatus Allofournierella excrementavium]|uniref:hypothetical protein n=1 Tax=Candidatus Allofournierella excrementavium TaxID=2838591 RepID=UPI003AF4D6FB
MDALITYIKRGEIAIPEIRRPFVRDSAKVRDSIDFLYDSFPVGYIIVRKNPDVCLKDGTISSGKKSSLAGSDASQFCMQ